MTSDWTNLPVNILDQVVQTLILSSTTTTTAADYHRFCAVCKRWHGVAVHKHNHDKYTAKYGVTPLLLISSPESNQRLLLNPVNKTTTPLSVPYNIKCSGSSHGWLAFSDESDKSIFLFHPYTLAKIHLPPLIDHNNPHIRDDIDDLEYEDDPHQPYLLEYYFFKVVLSADPTTNNDYVVALIYSGTMNLAFIRAADQTWTLTGLRNFFDVIFHKGLIYGAYGRDGIMSINPHGQGDLDRKLIKKPWFGDQEDKVMKTKLLVGQFYLVESADKQSLYKVLKVMKFDKESEYDCYTVEFRVSKLGINRHGQEICYWLKPEQGLEGHCFFVGSNHSLAVLPAKYPAARLPKDSIYFTDDYNWDTHGYLDQPYREIDVGVFHVKERNIGEPFYIPNNPKLPSSIWIEPSADFRSVV